MPFTAEYKISVVTELYLLVGSTQDSTFFSLLRHNSYIISLI